MNVRAICNQCGKIAEAPTMQEAEAKVEHRDTCAKHAVAKPAPKVVEVKAEDTTVEKPKAKAKKKPSEKTE